MNTEQLPKALRLAEKLRDIIRPLDCDFADDIDTNDLSLAAMEIESLHARNQELEAMLESIGAGGVSAQRVTQAEDHIAQDRKMVAVQEPFGYFKAEPFGWRDCAETDEGAVALYEAPQPQADARDAQQTLTRPVAAQKIPWDPIPTVDTWETCTIREAKELNPALWRIRMLYPQAAIDAAIAAAKGKSR